MSDFSQMNFCIPGLQPYRSEYMGAPVWICAENDEDAVKRGMQSRLSEQHLRATLERRDNGVWIKVFVEEQGR